MRNAIITDAQIAYIKANPASREEVFVAPFDFICAVQNDACEIDQEQGTELMGLMQLMPHVALIDMNDGGPIVRYCATCEDSLIFVEICMISQDRYYVTSLFNTDEEYILGYMGR